MPLSLRALEPSSHDPTSVAGAVSDSRSAWATLCEGGVNSAATFTLQPIPDLGYSRAAWAVADGGSGDPCPFVGHHAWVSCSDAAATLRWARPSESLLRQAASSERVGGGTSAADLGGVPGTGGSAFKGVLRPQARYPQQRAAATCAGFVSGADSAGAPPSAFRVVRPGASFGPHCQL